MPEIDMNNMECLFCKKRFQFVMTVFGPWAKETDEIMAHASVDWVYCPCGAKYSREKGWEK